MTDSVERDLVGGEDAPVEVRARWRWYTIDLLQLVSENGSHSERENLHRAIRALGKSGHLELSQELPYARPFAAYLDLYGRQVGGVDLNELAVVHPRWPHRNGRALWFRIPPPPKPPFDDQISVLDDIAVYRAGHFEDFVAAIDRTLCWSSKTGTLLTWLFCGGQPQPSWRLP
ncbi:hypothetical protein ACXYX3_27660 (plasmid) [Mycobacterium sp. C3-094]